MRWAILFTIFLHKFLVTTPIEDEMMALLPLVFASTFARFVRAGAYACIVPSRALCPLVHVRVERL